MAITKVLKSNNIVESIKYLTEEESHDGIHERVGSISTQNMSISGAKKEVTDVMKWFNKTNNIQAYIIIQSFAEDELNPDEQDDIEKANKAGMKLAKEVAGDERQVMVVTQADNGKVHNHILIANTNMVTGKALRGKYTGHKFISTKSDEILKEMDIRNKNCEREETYQNKQKISEIKRRDKGLYVWKDDLKSRIEECMENTDIYDIEMFIQRMKDKNVDVQVSKNGNISYKFIDDEGKERKSRASRLGNIYGKEGVEYAITENRNNSKYNIETAREFEYTRTRDIAESSTKYEYIDEKPRTTIGIDEQLNEQIRITKEINRRIREKREQEQIEERNRRIASERKRISKSNITIKSRNRSNRDKGIEY